jgi:hypothetical protein
MNTDLVVAVLAALVAVSTAVFTAATTSRQDRKGQEFKAKTDEELEKVRYELNAAVRQEDRTLAAREVLDRYRRPLLASAVQLARRIENIRHRSFLAYLASNDHRSEVALKSVLYRFAAYLGWRELLSRELTYLDFQDSTQTKDVLGLLDDVRTKFSSSRFDIVHGRPRLMLWTEEQSAIGGLMLSTEGTPGVIGFERFFNQYEDNFSLWLASFEQDLKVPEIVSSTRLREVSTSLDALLRKLDVHGVYGTHPDHAGSWQRADASHESADH